MDSIPATTVVPSSSSTARATTAALANESGSGSGSASTGAPQRNHNRRGNRSSNQHPESSGRKDASVKDHKGPNSHRHDHRKREKEKERDKQAENKAESAPNPRAPRTIAATDPIDLHPEKKTTATATATGEANINAAADVTAEGDIEQHSCFICTESIVIFAVSDCNHRTCHLCSLRLRALYKTKNCAYCKAEQNIMVFTRDAEKPFEEYDFKAMAFFDRKLNIYFEDQEMYEDTMVLLRFNCPDPTCEVACPDGWNQLKSHVKKVHKLMLCDLCVRHKKVFAHEHNLMTASQLMRHFRSGDSGQTNQNSSEPSGFKGHPECGFCKESFYGDDELFEHCKKNHEQCFLCIRRNIRHQYYNKYPDLERHFYAEHYACMDPECLEKKFVVFDSDLDLKAHEAEMHPNSTHGQRNKLRDARKIDISFGYQPTGESSGSRRGGRGNRQSERDGQGRRDQEEDSPRQPQLTPHQIQQIALQKQLAEEQEKRLKEETEAASAAAQEGLSEMSLESSSSPTGSKTMLRTRPPAGFGSSLSEPVPVRAQSPAMSAAARVAANIQRTNSPLRASSPVVVTQSAADWPAVSAASTTTTPSSSNSAAQPKPASSSSTSKGVAPDTLNKHAALQDRVQQYLQGTSGTLSQFRTLTTQFRNSQIPANQYVASLSSLFGSDLEKTGKIIQGLYEILDSESKKSEMMRAWNDFKAVQNQFPSLESAVTSNPTMADIATPSMRRVLVIKSSGTTRGGSGHTKPKSTATWDRAAAAASSLNRNNSPSGSKSATPVFYPTPQLNPTLAWSVPRSADSTPEQSVSVASNGRSGQTPGSWAGIPQSSASNTSTPQFRPSTASYGRPTTSTSTEHFPSLASQAPTGSRPSLGLMPVQKNKNQSNNDEMPNGWVTGWNSLADADEESGAGKKKKNKKKILFHVG